MHKKNISRFTSNIPVPFVSADMQINFFPLFRAIVAILNPKRFLDGGNEGDGFFFSVYVIFSAQQTGDCQSRLM